MKWSCVIFNKFKPFWIHIQGFSEERINMKVTVLLFYLLKTLIFLEGYCLVATMNQKRFFKFELELQLNRMNFAKIKIRFSLLIAILLCVLCLSAKAQPKGNGSELDKKVESFLDRHQYRWHDMNIPTEDGKLLYELIVKNNYKNVVEIGTSTGHSAIWLAWALSKTGGKLITIEINESRQQKALANFKEAGVDGYIDSRLGDAHKLVPQLKEPIDFVFCDADKSWYKNYFKSLKSKISPGGCFAAHNVTRQSPDPAILDFLKYADKLSGYKTSIENQSSSGVSLSFRQK